MKKTKFAALCAALLLWATTTLALAWPGGAPAKVLLTGPGIEGAVEVSDVVILEGLGAEEFINWDAPRTFQPFAADGYELVRYYKDGNHYWALDRVRYYPNPNGGRGAVLYVGGVDVNTGGGIWNGKWFDATPEGDAGMARLLKYVHASPAAQGKTAVTTNDNAKASPITTAAKADDGLMPLGAVAVALALVGVGALGYWLGRATRKERV